MTHNQKSSPATLVAILVAARRAGDRELERDMRELLKQRHGVKLTFLTTPKPEVSHAP